MAPSNFKLKLTLKKNKSNETFYQKKYKRFLFWFTSYTFFAVSKERGLKMENSLSQPTNTTEAPVITESSTTTTNASRTSSIPNDSVAAAPTEVDGEAEEEAGGEEEGDEVEEIVQPDNNIDMTEVSSTI